MSYNYLEAMKEDIKQYVRDNNILSEYDGPEEAKEALYDDLWVEDSVTGNGSGSYTFNSKEAYDNIQGDPAAMSYIRELVSEFDTPAETVAEKFLEEDYEYWDVSIRCYLLSQAIDEAIDEIEDDLEQGKF